MDPDIHFGEVEQTPTTTRLRPDCNGQLAVVALYEPHAEDLPIFVDLDVMRDMLDHAHSDRRVELGGVLLGGQYADDNGRPFVLITDCLRAQHYESTKGSFKFTHDTWEQITREREQLPTELQMVGWYHTHPDWGVFLSGLDMFICDNFFNKPLDVALVIDPCQHETGFFQWTNKPEQRIRQTGGYSIFASRFRHEELREFVTELEGQTMPESGRSLNPPISVHMPPPPPAPAWQTLAVIGILGMQFCFMMLLAIRLLPTSNDQVASSEITTVRQSIDRLEAAQQRNAEVDAKLEVLEMVVRREGDLPKGILNSLAERTSEVDELRGSLRGQQSLVREQDGKISGLETALAEIRGKHEESQTQISKLRKTTDELHADLRTARQEIAKATKSTGAESAELESSSWSRWWAEGRSVGLGALLGAVAVGATMFVVMRRRFGLDPTFEKQDVSKSQKDDE